MNSSGIKRGLAVSALFALAAAGLPGTANAGTVDQQVGADEVVTIDPDVIIDPYEQARIDSITARWNGPADNVVTVRTTDLAVGNIIWIWNLHPEGTWRTPIQTKRVPADGVVTFTVKDYNGFKVNQFRVKVGPNPEHTDKPSPFWYVKQQ